MMINMNTQITAYIQLNNTANRDTLQKAYKNKTTHKGDAGLDLYCMEPTTITPVEVTCSINLGFSMVIVAITIVNHKPVSTPMAFMLLARSSTYKTGLMQCNCMGIIDAGYRGNLMVPVLSLSGHTIAVSQYDRLFQAVPFDGLGVDDVVILEKGQDLSSMFPSDRGTGGFGSTGKGHDHATN